MFSIYNKAQSVEDPTGKFPQAEPDKVDFDILVAGLNGTGIISGGAVTAQGSPDMTVAVAAGSVQVATTAPAQTVAAGNVVITAADSSNPRFDLVVADNTGAKSAVQGTASATPVFPAIPANSVVLAAVYVPAGATTITTARIVDKRVMLNNRGKRGRSTVVTAMSTSATFTTAALLGGLITANQAAAGAATYTMPTGTVMDAAMPADFVVGDSFDFSITNISTVAAEDVTVAGALGMVAKGNLFVPSNDATSSIAFATFRVVKEAANTYSFYRIG